MEENIVIQLKRTTLNYNGVQAIKEKIISSARKAALEGKGSVSTQLSKPEFDAKKIQQLIRSLEEDGFFISTERTDNSFEVVVSWV